MTQDEIDQVQAEFEKETQSLDITYWRDHDIGNKIHVEGLWAEKKAIENKYAALYPEWKAWSDELLKHAVG